MTKEMWVNAGLAALAALAGGVASSSNLLPDAWLSVPVIAVAYGALRIAAGYVAANVLQKPISVDK